MLSPQQQRPDIARLMQLHAQAQAGQAASLANLVQGPPGLPALPPGALAQSLGLPPGLQGLPPGLNIPTSLSSSLLQSLPTSIAASLGGLGPNPLHPALSMLKPQLPIEPKREDEVRKSLSESNGKTSKSCVAILDMYHRPTMLVWSHPWTLVWCVARCPPSNKESNVSHLPPPPPTLRYSTQTAMAWRITDVGSHPFVFNKLGLSASVIPARHRCWWRCVVVADGAVCAGLPWAEWGGLPDSPVSTIL